MADTPKLGLRKIEGIDIVNKDVWNDNYDKIDENAASQDDFDAHKSAAVLDHPDSSVTDSKIGTRTIDDTITAAAGADTPTRLWSKLANMIKRITGKAEWWTAPATTLETANTHINATTGIHGATSAATPNTIVQRDANGWIAGRGLFLENPSAPVIRLKEGDTSKEYFFVVDGEVLRIREGTLSGADVFTAGPDGVVRVPRAPTNLTDVARKAETDAVQTNLNNHAAVNATTTQRGHALLLDSVADNSIVHAATANAAKVAYDRGSEALTAANNAQTTADSKLLHRIVTTGTFDFNAQSGGSWMAELKNNSSITVLNGPPGTTSGTVIQGEGSHGGWVEQLMLAQGNNTIWYRTSYESGGVVWNPWVRLVTSAGGDVGALYLGNNVALWGRAADNTPELLAHRSPDGITQIGTENRKTTIRSNVVPTFVIGASEVNALHSGGDQSKYGSLIFSNNTGIIGRDTLGDTRMVAYLNTSNQVVLGSTANPTYINSYDNPKWFNGSASYDIHTTATQPKVTVSSSAPSSPAVGDVWIDTSS